ncbi:MAG: TetR family transcriptional regulator C-terminal domain-containing protein [Rhodobacteraceae bacterium]|nr:TetR family transcriptional regulator C-terminal domain-containing protein [Paracoccaceae bacterium]
MTQSDPQTDPGGQGPAGRVRKERKANADMRRLQLIDATLRSVVRHGLARTTLATVAREAGLSQGAAVFYFRTKQCLFDATLREAYRRYEANWMQALAAAGPDPADHLLALLDADFNAEVCSRDALAVWFAFWGELKSTETYAAIAADFDARRLAQLRRICMALTGDAREAARLTDWLDTFCDGYWLNLYLFPDSHSPRDARQALRRLLARLLPGGVRIDPLP